jgi:hypothetical protein
MNLQNSGYVWSVKRNGRNKNVCFFEEQTFLAENLIIFYLYNRYVIL